MKLFNRFRSRSKLQQTPRPPEATVYPTYNVQEFAPKLPERVLKDIFATICPHAQDETYITCENSMTEGGCRLCDMRDLASCARVCKAWAEIAQQAL